MVVNRRTGRQAVINKAEFALGRDPKWADFAVEDNSNVSSAHAIIRYTDSQYFIMDTNSTNHVKVNGQRIPPNQDVPLNPGSTFALGDEEFEFR
jgi:pSer/pThr/pTyr-binding forkhead associated (FHA) protein